jgi:SNF2 family DNA or RNA helicase
LKGLFDGMKIKKAIIICPATLKNYWKDELSNWCPKIPI